MKRKTILLVTFVSLFANFFNARRIYGQGIESINHWLDSAVKYIITNKERSTFMKQKQREKKIQFIKFFWARRDPNDRTPRNEFIDEYLRRINFANKNFKTAHKPGWKTTRGHIYITFGPPDEVYSGVISDKQEVLDKTYPSQRYIIWDYRNLSAKSLPPNYEIVFIDLYGDGDYRISQSQYFKKSRFEKKMDELFKHPRLSYYPPEIVNTIRFINQENIIQKNLSHQSDIPNVTFGGIPFLLTGDFKPAGDFVINFSFDIGIKYKDLTFNIRMDSVSPDLLLQGLLFNKNNKLLDSFEQTIDSEIPSKQLKELWDELLFCQTVLKAPPGDYLIQILLLDKISGRIGVFERNINFPAIETKE